MQYNSSDIGNNRMLIMRFGVGCKIFCLVDATGQLTINLFAVLPFDARNKVGYEPNDSP